MSRPELWADAQTFLSQNGSSQFGQDSTANQRSAMCSCIGLQEMQSLRKRYGSDRIFDMLDGHTSGMNRAPLPGSKAWNRQPASEPWCFASHQEELFRNPGMVDACGAQYQDSTGLFFIKNDASSESTSDPEDPCRCLRQSDALAYRLGKNSWGCHRWPGEPSKEPICVVHSTNAKECERRVGAVPSNNGDIWWRRCELDK